MGHNVRVRPRSSGPDVTISQTRLSKVLFTYLAVVPDFSLVAELAQHLVRWLLEALAFQIPVAKKQSRRMQLSAASCFNAAAPGA